MRRMDGTTPSGMAEFRVGERGRSVLPAEVRRAARVEEGDQMVARAEGPGRIVLETRDAIAARVWAAAPTATGLDVTADVRAMRDEDNAISDANFVRRAAEGDDEASRSAGQRLLAELGL